MKGYLLKGNFKFVSRSLRQEVYKIFPLKKYGLADFKMTEVQAL